MKTKRSMWLVLMCAAGAGLLVTNCTVKTDDDEGCTPKEKKTGCECADKSEGYQVCTSEGIYGSCVCPDPNVGGGANGGGTSTAGAAGTEVGAGAGGMSEAGAGEGGAGGEAGGTVIDATDCYSCLAQLCAAEWNACVAEDENNPPDTTSPGDYCLSSMGNESGQIEGIMTCITGLRSMGLAKREAVRSCGASLGKSSDPSFFEWPPMKMTPATEQLLNCMADAPDEMEPGAWASQDVVSTPWVAGTCAKLACTSAL